MTNTTIADHGRRWRKCTPHKALCSTPTHWIDGWQPPEQADIFLGCWGCVWPSNTPILWQCIITGTKEHFKGYTHLESPPNIISTCLGGCCPSIQCINAERKALCGALGGHFCRRRPWLWRLWHQLCVVVAWPEPKPLWSNETPAWWVLPASSNSKHC